MNLVNLKIYTPDPIPEGYPDGALFLIDDGGNDWYESQSQFTQGNIFIQVDSSENVVSMSNEISMLWPLGCSVYEVAAGDIPAGMTSPEGWRYSGGQISEIVPDISELAAEKNLAITAAYDAERENGFVSSALGAEHLYRGNDRGQADLEGAVLAGVDISFPCFDSVGAWDRRLHTPAQMQQVFTDGLARLTALNMYEDALRQSVEDAVSVNDSAAISGLDINFSAI